MGLRRRLFSLQATTLAIVTLGAVGGWGVSTWISGRADVQANLLAQEVDHLAHTSFDLLGAFPHTGQYLLATSPQDVARLIQLDAKGLQQFRRKLDEHLATSQMSAQDADLHRELETIRLLSVQAERNLLRTRQEALAAAAQQRPIAAAALARAVQDPSLGLMRGHSAQLASLHDKLDSQLSSLITRQRQAQRWGITIGIAMLLLAWLIGLVFAWRTADRILSPLLRLEQLMRASAQDLPARVDEQELGRAPEEIASLHRSFRELQHQVQQLVRQLESLANTDGLTAVGNRRRFDEALEQEWRRSLRSGSKLSLLLLDVDHFKAYNDHYGHVQGDICLRQVAAAIASQARRSSDLVCRFGGEEFAVLLPAIAEMEALGLAQAIVAAVDALAIKHERSPVAAWVTVSAGLASCLPSPGGSASTLVEQADAALYRRKQQQGRHGVTAAAPDLDAEQSPAVAQPSGLPLQGLA